MEFNLKNIAKQKSKISALATLAGKKMYSSYFKNSLPIVILLCLSITISSHFKKADGSGVDEGLLVYAGATSVLKGSNYPSRQRPPMYSLFVAGLGKIVNINTEQTEKLGKDFGALEFFETAIDFTSDDFNRLMLWANIVIWLMTILFVCLSLRVFGVNPLIAVVLSLLPSAWAMTLTVHEAVLSQFFLSVGFYFLSLGIKKEKILYFIAASSFFAFASLTAAILQLVIPSIIIPLFLLLWKKSGFYNAFKLAISLTLGLALIGGWAFRNYNLHGFFGMSGVLGSGMGSKTARFLERAEDKYPLETEVFVQFRNREMIQGESHTGMMWGKRANMWLMQERGMSFAEANKFMLQFNLSAIKAAPLNYAEEVGSSLIRYLFPATPNMPNILRIPLIGVEFLIIFIFLFLSLFWMATHILPRVTNETIKNWNSTDTAILCAVSIFFYCAITASLVDIGKPAQRGHIQFLIPLIISLIWVRLRYFEVTT